jgi:signal transduction histidine kinase
MNSTKQSSINLHFTALPGYADYLLKERLHDFVKTLYRISLELDIPLLKYFSGMEEKEIIRMSTEGNIKLLTAIKNNALSEYIAESTNNWVKNQLPIITKTDVISDDIGLINYARKKALRELLLDYTSNANQSLKIIDEIDRFILSLESILYKTYLNIQQEQLTGTNAQLKRREHELLEAQDVGKIGSFEWDMTATKQSSYTPEVFKIFEFESATNLEEFLKDVHPEDRMKLKGAMEKAFHDGFYECEYRYSRNNHNKVLYSRGKVLFDKGQPVKMIGTVTDITEKANLISRLTESEELSKQAQALTNTGNWKWSVNSDTIEWSDEMYRIYGLEPQSEQITFARFLAFIDDEDRNKRLAEISEAIKTGVASDYIMRINSLDGKRKILKGKGRVLLDKAGNSTGMLGTCQDITNEHQLSNELRNKNEELVRKNKDLESFNFIASHDLQEPLRKIQTYTSRMLHEGESIPENLMKYLDKISHSSTRMQKIIEDFLVFYHSLSSTDNIETVDLNEVVKDAAKMLSEIMTRNNVRFSVAHLPKVNGRRIRLTEMFRHLISNAIKFGKHDTPTEINVSAKAYSRDNGKSYVMISVSDNGIGFDQKYSERIFDLFQKLYSQDEYAGSGIGLSLCKRIIEDHSGWISVVSQPQLGSTFNVFIPAIE